MLFGPCQRTDLQCYTWHTFNKCTFVIGNFHTRVISVLCQNHAVVSMIQDLLVSDFPFHQDTTVECVHARQGRVQGSAKGFGCYSDYISYLRYNSIV